MLILFESTVVFQRLKTLQEFRNMSQPPFALFVHRTSWIEIQSTDLLPGDLCSIVDGCVIPGDIVLVAGGCIINEAMLSGESTPQLKENARGRESNEVLDMAVDRGNLLFGGTKVIQVTAETEKLDCKSPDGGCLGVVVRTGFATQQGKLVRTIMFSSDRVTANNLESLFFILFLLVFAVIASVYVWQTASREDDRDQTKLLLHCIMIITSVVPPELPMELSMAVNNSLAALSKQFIYCSEPFRIPLAGRIDVACFDKTGTLTKEDLVVEGVAGLGKGKKGGKGVVEPAGFPKETAMVIASAHSLVVIDGVVGDPMEKNGVECVGWTVGEFGVMTKDKDRVEIVRRFAFSSMLKRMSTVSLLGSGKDRKVFVACKGAPETLKSMFKVVPDSYDEDYKYHARLGKRVIALGHKTLPSTPIKDLHRAEVECDLIFAGFLVFYCPLKDDSVEAVRMLNQSSHRTVMITGDNPLTACHIAREVDIIGRKALIADLWPEGVCWKTVDENITIQIDLDSDGTEVCEYDLCVTGAALTYMEKSVMFEKLLPRIWVYARVCGRF